MTSAIMMLAYGYLRSPNAEDVARLLAIGESRGFPGMLGSIDCMHWKWKNCPNAWRGSHNDINVLERSDVFANLAEGPQESARKDVEWAFGVLQARFAIVRGPARSYEPEMLKEIMMACIILHNMIVEDERDLYLGADEFDYEQINDIPLEPPSHEHTVELVDFIQNLHRIRDRETHSQLQSDLIEHLWQIHSQS
ncbi:hypothetical protein SLA2020_434070 [Shorea laevis]